MTRSPLRGESSLGTGEIHISTVNIITLACVDHSCNATQTKTYSTFYSQYCIMPYLFNNPFAVCGVHHAEANQACLYAHIKGKSGIQSSTVV